MGVKYKYWRDTLTHGITRLGARRLFVSQTSDLGSRPGGRRHKVDITAEISGGEFLIWMKWQQNSGTAEQKVPFEIIWLAEAIRETPSYKRSYVVLGGPGWTLKDYCVEKIQQHLVGTKVLKVLSLEVFVALANEGKL